MDETAAKAPFHFLPEIIQIKKIKLNKTHVCRILTAILYLNFDWNEGDGGELRIWKLNVRGEKREGGGRGGLPKRRCTHTLKHTHTHTHHGHSFTTHALTLL